MAEKMSKDEGSFTENKAGGTKPKPADIGKSPQELRGSVNSYVGFDPVPDPEDAGFAPEAQGAMDYEKSGASYNAPYEDGGGLYSKPRRSK